MPSSYFSALASYRWELQSAVEDNGNTIRFAAMDESEMCNLDRSAGSLTVRLCCAITKLLALGQISVITQHLLTATSQSENES